MRLVWSGLSAAAFTLLMVQPSAAQRVLSFEPLAMDPYSTVYVDNGSCSAGKVLKVQGAPNNQRRKKSCVPLSDLRGANGTLRTK
ncbi:DUF6719 family protein [Tardiphaga sp.]|jgi:hypothetical protein|uniref:DUF6719 family protein n=1 Tax=Tardiphaga sp. TaxID=1926292 RepID=UPI0037D9BF04